MKRCPVIVSACLVGIKSRHDGTDALSGDVLASLGDAVIIPVCPEQLGGLPTPRPMAEITGGDGTDVLKIDVLGIDALKKTARVVDENGRDVTLNFIKGAEAALSIAKLSGTGKAILKERSPSCGVKRIVRSGKEAPGMGVTAALLKREGIEIEGVG
ncbi:MAG: DUF523 domain-containing protein [Deltaproteobacteria bacterium]|nr:DUF523 domain-containing protein [Deltaproteobacteria bacterium]